LDADVGEWSSEHTVATRAARADAWAHWSDLRNHMRLEPGVERIKLDGPFVTGTTGRTVALALTSEWRLSDVVPEKRFVIAGFTPDGAGALCFAWEFIDDGNGGTHITQRIQAAGPEVEHHMAVFR
jgi:Polyketide cyclase / dehydrase and lipid transport